MISLLPFRRKAFSFVKFFLSRGKTINLDCLFFHNTTHILRFFLRFRFGDRKEILRDRLEEFERPLSIDVISGHYILRDRWRNLRDRFGPSKHLKKNTGYATGDNLAIVSESNRTLLHQWVDWTLLFAGGVILRWTRYRTRFRSSFSLPMIARCCLLLSTSSKTSHSFRIRFSIRLNHVQILLMS